MQSIFKGNMHFELGMAFYHQSKRALEPTIKELVAEESQAGEKQSKKSEKKMSIEMKLEALSEKLPLEELREKLTDDKSRLDRLWTENTFFEKSKTKEDDLLVQKLLTELSFLEKARSIMTWEDKPAKEQLLKGLVFIKKELQDITLSEFRKKR